MLVSFHCEHANQGANAVSCGFETACSRSRQSRGRCGRRVRVASIDAPMPENVRTAVIAGAIGYKLLRFVAFVAPLRIHYTGDIVLLVGPNTAPEILSFCERQQVLLREVNSTVTCHHYNNLRKDALCPGLALSRFTLLADACRPYDYCFSIDFRDVIFQGNPFASFSFGAAHEGKVRGGRQQSRKIAQKNGLQYSRASLSRLMVLSLEDKSKNMQTSFFNAQWANK